LVSSIVVAICDLVTKYPSSALYEDIISIQAAALLGTWKEWILVSFREQQCR
jgi:hypothetical protein